MKYSFTRRLNLNSLACLIAAVIAAGCSTTELPDYVRLGGLRILAIKADKPEAAPGDTVQITPVVSDLPTATVAGKRSLSYTAEACIDPGVGYGATPICAGRPDRITLPGGNIPSLSSTSNTYTGEAPVISVTIPPIILAHRSAMDQYNGVAYLVLYTLIATDSTGATAQVIAFKRLLASTRTTKNSNPSITDVQVGSTQTLQPLLAALSYPSSSQTPLSLTPTFSSNSAEAYTVQQADGSLLPATEALTTTWFLSDGDIRYFRTADADVNTWTPPSTQPTRPGIVFMVVTRDGRGGEDYKKFEY
ncbi:hypothetical protein WDW37_20960 [Bdellovibrionota bacterium FG-1]